MEGDLVRSRLNRTRKLQTMIIVPALAIVGMFIVSSLSVAEWGLELDWVDIGNVTSEDDANAMDGWGEVVTCDGNDGWGGLVGNCRVVWTGDGDDPTATVTLSLLGTFQGAVQYVSMRVLDGQGDDSFSVSVFDPENLEWVMVYSYASKSLTDPDGDAEQWIEHTIWLNDLETWECLVPHGAPLYAEDGFQIMIEATGEPWGGIDTYGQLAVDWIYLYGSGRAH